KQDLVLHLLAEEKRRNRRGQWEWIVVSAKNHLLDCAVIALAMGDQECWGGVEALHNPQCIPIGRAAPGAEVGEKQSKRPASGRRVISRGVE
ncbi:MAG: hypothetical protein ABIJ57_06320, partial [Pseudomonadota bacterium]